MVPMNMLDGACNHADYISFLSMVKSRRHKRYGITDLKTGSEQV